MKKMLCLMLVLGSSVCASAQALRVVTEDLPPYQIVVNGKLVAGSSYLVAKEMLERAELDSRIEVLPWARAYAIASTEPNVVIFSMTRSQERDPYFHWLLKLDSLTYNFYSLSSRPEAQVNSLTEVLNYTVATVRDSFEAKALVKMGFIEGKNLILTVTYKEAWLLVQMGRANFTYAYYVAQDDIFKVPKGKQPLFFKGYNVGQSFDLYLAANINTDQEILDKLKTSLLAMQQDGTMTALLSRSLDF
jgi:polar amino acid transport system substrate-binding protein